MSRKTIVSCGACALVLVLISVSCSSYRNIRHEYIPFSRHPVQGLDVSHHQGEIDWERVAHTKFTFVYMKATEGGDHVDTRFHYNFEEARKNGLIAGAYHFFSFSSGGTEQARNFIAAVPALPRMLPPVIDLEYMGQSKREESTEALHRELAVFISEIEEHYNVRPILYSNHAFYNRYLSGHFSGYRLWIADYFKRPRISDNRPWLFWQYTDRGRVPGISGYVDFNVFNGTEDDLEAILTEGQR